jgi:hypothetical protein
VGARTIAKAKAQYPDLYFVLGDIEDTGTINSLEGAFDYIVMADTIGMLEDIDGTIDSEVMLSCNAYHHRGTAGCS